MSARRAGRFCGVIALTAAPDPATRELVRGLRTSASRCGCNAGASQSVCGRCMLNVDGAGEMRSFAG